MEGYSLRSSSAARIFGPAPRLSIRSIADEEMAEYCGIDFWPDSGSLLVLFSLRGNPPYGHLLGQHAVDRSILPRRQIFRSHEHMGSQFFLLICGLHGRGGVCEIAKQLEAQI
jgi:hypothetical protein